MGTGLREISTGVALLLPECLDPVVIAAGPASPDFDLDVALPLLTRRRRVFMAGPHVRADELPARFALLVAPSCQTPLLADPRVSALVMFDLTHARPEFSCPVLVIAREGLPAAGPSTGDVRFAEASHAAEQAHLIDAFLRAPQRYPARSTIVRAQP